MVAGKQAQNRKRVAQLQPQPQNMSIIEQKYSDNAILPKAMATIASELDIEHQRFQTPLQQAETVVTDNFSQFSALMAKLQDPSITNSILDKLCSPQERREQASKMLACSTSTTSTKQTMCTSYRHDRSTETKEKVNRRNSNLLRERYPILHDGYKKLKTLLRT